MLLLPSQALAYAVHISAAERAAGRPTPETAQHAAELLCELGYVALTAAPESVVPSSLVSNAASRAGIELRGMLSRLENVGFDPHEDSFTFSEICHRSTRRYDMRFSRRRARSAPWRPVSAAVAAWIAPVLEAAEVQRPLRPVLEGVVTSLPGAPVQAFHMDGQHGFNAIVPLVDVGAHGTGTEFWPGSHRDASVAAAAMRGPLVCPASQEVVQPKLGAGDVLLYDYRVVHRGPANQGPHERPLYYSAYAGDTWNFPEERLAAVERRQRMFGVRKALGLA
jgi:hypothetical protein